MIEAPVLFCHGGLLMEPKLIDFIGALIIFFALQFVTNPELTDEESLMQELHQLSLRWKSQKGFLQGGTHAKDVPIYVIFQPEQSVFHQAVGYAYLPDGRLGFVRFETGEVEYLPRKPGGYKIIRDSHPIRKKSDKRSGVVVCVDASFLLPHWSEDQ